MEDGVQILTGDPALAPGARPSGGQAGSMQVATPPAKPEEALPITDTATLTKALEAADRSALGLNAPPHGLYFVQALYD